MGKRYDQEFVLATIRREQRKALERALLKTDKAMETRNEEIEDHALAIPKENPNSFGYNGHEQKNISFEELVYGLVSYYRLQCRKTGKTLGIGLTALTGQKAREWVKQALGYHVVVRTRKPSKPEDAEAYQLRMQQARKRSLADDAQVWRNGPGWSPTAIRQVRRGTTDEPRRVFGLEE